jgi:hypothetical protein
MKPELSKITLALGIILMGTLSSGKALAACGDLTKVKARPSLLPQSWDRQAGSFLRVDDDHDPSIVGMWHATFTAKTQNESPIPNTVIDNALVVWHRDKTEIMNSARPPQDGDFCLGVWEKTGKSTYKLNHFAWLANDTTNAPYGIGNPSGPTHLVEEVTLSPDGMHYSGTFTLTAYDTSGHIAISFAGVIAATRITIHTTVPDLL